MPIHRRGNVRNDLYHNKLAVFCFGKVIIRLTIYLLIGLVEHEFVVVSIAV